MATRALHTIRDRGTECFFLKYSLLDSDVSHYSWLVKCQSLLRFIGKASYCGYRYFGDYCICGRYTVVASLQAFRTFSVVLRVVFRNYSVILGVKNRNYSFFGVMRRLFGSWLDKYFRCRFWADFSDFRCQFWVSMPILGRFLLFSIRILGIICIFVPKLQSIWHISRDILTRNSANGKKTLVANHCWYVVRAKWANPLR